MWVRCQYDVLWPSSEQSKGNARAAIPGLQFWVVVRTILEKCKDVEEAVEYAKTVPIAYNINLLLADKGGRAALIETLDGRFALRSIGDDSAKQYLHSTNHAHVEELIAHEPLADAQFSGSLPADTAVLGSTNNTRRSNETIGKLAVMR